MPHIDILVERLKQLDPNELIERLDISSEEIVDRFMDKIEDNVEDLDGEFEELYYDDDDFNDEDYSDGFQEITLPWEGEDEFKG
jgi:enoyl-[acyl-carrier-protein] reductase (NADH)